MKNYTATPIRRQKACPNGASVVMDPVSSLHGVAVEPVPHQRLGRPSWIAPRRVTKVRLDDVAPVGPPATTISVPVSGIERVHGFRSRTDNGAALTWTAHKMADQVRRGGTTFCTHKRLCNPRITSLISPRPDSYLPLHLQSAWSVRTKHTHCELY